MSRRNDAQVVILRSGRAATKNLAFRSLDERDSSLAVLAQNDSLLCQRGRRRSRPRRGLTLLEVLLAITLAVALVIAMLAFYRQVIDVREAVALEADIIGSERLVMDLATADLRAALAPMPTQALTGSAAGGQGLTGTAAEGQGLTASAPSVPPFQGTTSNMQFATTVVPGADAWLVQTVVDTPVSTSGGDVQIVGYRLSLSQDEAGQTVVNGIERTVQKMPPPPSEVSMEEGKQIDVKLLAPSWKFLRLRYWDGASWLDSWGQSEPPAAVEIVMGEKPLPEGTAPADYAFPMFRRVVYLPAGTQTASGTVVLGLDEGASP